MVAEKYLKAGFVVGASLAILSASLPSFAQMTLQTPRGEQTVAPSKMAQQSTGAKSSATAQTPQSNGIVLPEGTPSSMRIGPVEPVPMWQRAALAFWMTINLVVMGLVAVALTLMSKRDADEHGGHMIHPDTTEAGFGGPIGTGVVYKQG